MATIIFFCVKFYLQKKGINATWWQHYLNYWSVDTLYIILSFLFCVFASISGHWLSSWLYTNLLSPWFQWPLWTEIPVSTNLVVSVGRGVAFCTTVFLAIRRCHGLSLTKNRGETYVVGIYKVLAYGVYGPVPVSYFIFSKFCSLNALLNSYWVPRYISKKCV